MKAFGKIGGGIFPIPAVIAGEVEKQYGVAMVGLAEEVFVKYYAISVQCRLTHPALVTSAQVTAKTVAEEMPPVETMGD